MKRSIVLMLVVSLTLLLFVALYNIVDNQRVVLVEQQITIEHLPPAFMGFRILQISDLHGRYFGPNQERLLSLINKTDYDMLAITGDMSNGYLSKPDDRPFFHLLDGIQNKEQVFYASGNTGPWGIRTFEGGLTNGALTPEGEALEARGVHNLNRPYVIQRGKSRLWVGELWFVEWLEIFEVGFSEQRLGDPTLTLEEAALYESAKTYAQELIAVLEGIRPDDTLIGVTHIPFSIDSVSEMPKNAPPYDLILAGHYHGGQIRIPLVGALYVPDAASETRGFFLSEERVSGLRNWGAFQQYISRGLGSSSSIRWLNFRLFNTPEINLITLKGAK